TAERATMQPWARAGRGPRTIARPAIVSQPNNFVDFIFPPMLSSKLSSLRPRFNNQNLLLVQMLHDRRRRGSAPITAQPIEPLLQVLFAHLSQHARDDAAFLVDERGAGDRLAHVELRQIVAR